MSIHQKEGTFVIASEAKQSMTSDIEKNWIASSLRSSR